MTHEKLIKGYTYTRVCAGCGKSFEFTYTGKGPAIKRCSDCPVPSRSNSKKHGDIIKSVCNQCNEEFEYPYAGTGPIKSTCAKCSIQTLHGTKVCVTCIVCGTEFSYTYIGGTLSTQCSKCKNSRYSKTKVSTRIQKRGWQQGDQVVAVCSYCHNEFSYPRKHKPRSCCDDCHKLRDKIVKQRRRAFTNANSWNQADWINTLESFGCVCAYCGCITDKPEQEHFIPIALGGETKPGNIVPACRSCNARKHDKHPKDFCSQETYNRITKILSSIEN